MIEQTYPSKRPVKAVTYHSNQPWYAPMDYQQAQARKITPAEFLRRDSIVREMFRTCAWRNGDTGFPSNKKDYEKYGVFIVIGVLSTYRDTSYDHEWPKSDNPMIVTIKSLKDPTQIMFCTPAWLEKKNPHLLLEKC
jgi:hypothetical protein